MATESMNPAPKATSSSMTRSSRTARRVTASAPSTLPAAAIRAYSRALDTREQVLPGVARRILEHFVQQAGERLADVGTWPHAGGDEIVPFYGKVLECQWLTRSTDALDSGTEHGARSREQRQQVICAFTDGGQPATGRNNIFGIRILVPPEPDGSTALDVFARAFQARQ